MTPFCTITPTRGDRPELLAFCKHQLSRMTVKPNRSYFIDYKPMSDKIDLVERVKKGVEQAKQDGYEYVFIVEDDDYYPATYFEKFDIGSYAFYGSQETWYYNLRDLTYSSFQHHNRSSLFITGFNVKYLKTFNWTAPRNKFLDISLWEHANTSDGVRQFVHPGAIGIKHNLGLCAGRGHVNRGKHEDAGKEWLRSNVDSEAFTFYTDLMKRL